MNVKRRVASFTELKLAACRLLDAAVVVGERVTRRTSPKYFLHFAAKVLECRRRRVGEQPRQRHCNAVRRRRSLHAATAKICSELKPLEGGRSSDHIPVLLTVSLDAKAEPDDDEVEFSHVRTADERNAEGFANAEFVG